MLSDETNTINNTAPNSTGKMQATAEIQQFTAYLLRVVPLAADLNSTNETEEFKRALEEKPSAVDGVRRFLSDPQCVVLFIRIVQPGKGTCLYLYRTMIYHSFDIVWNIDEEQDGVDGTDTNGNSSIQFEFSTETTYAAQKGMR